MAYGDIDRLREQIERMRGMESPEARNRRMLEEQLRRMMLGESIKEKADPLGFFKADTRTGLPEPLEKLGEWMHEKHPSKEEAFQDREQRRLEEAEKIKVQDISAIPSTETPVDRVPVPELPRYMPEDQIEGFKIDPFTGKVVDTQEGQRPNIEGEDYDKIDLIRAQARMKSRGGSLQSPEGAEPLPSDFGPPTGGAFSQNELTAQMQQRADDDLLFAAESDANFASWMLQTPEIRERMRTKPAVIGEMLQRLSSAATEDARAALGMRLIELGTGPGGKLSPEVASKYQIMTGEAPPAGLVGIDRLDASKSLYGIRNDIDRSIAMAAQSLNPQFAAAMSHYGRQASAEIRKAEAQLNAGADPNMVMERAYASIAAIKAELGVDSMEQVMQQIPGTRPQPQQNLGVVGIER
jgi:hypothetical protein